MSQGSAPAGVLGLALSLLVAPASAQSPRTIERTVHLDAGGRLRIVATKGSLRLTSWDNPQVEVRARIDPPEEADADYARRAVEASRVEIIGDRSAVTVRSNYDDVPVREAWYGRSRWLPPIHYEIRAPHQLTVELDVDRTPTRLAGFEGRIDIESDRGSLEARDLRGTIRIDIDRGARSGVVGLAGRLVLDADRTDLVIDRPRITTDSRLVVDRGEIELRLSPSEPVSVRADVGRRGSLSSDFEVTGLHGQVGGRGISGDATAQVGGGGPELLVRADRAEVSLRRARE